MILLEGMQNIGLLVLRLAVAAIFFRHGWAKLKNMKKIGSFMTFIGICETLGSLALIAGFLTELASLGFAVIMLGAIYMKNFKWGVPFSFDKGTGWEFDLLLFAAAILLISSGAGNMSLDAFLGWWP